jgi:hypothetical protein
MFAEPGYFLITPKNVIRYMTISSSPVGGRVDIDTGDFIYVYIFVYIHIFIYTYIIFTKPYHIKHHFG